MFALAIHYLNGWSMAAADGAAKKKAEWPPHPDRVFMALAAAWFETGEHAEEGEALRWLEGLAPPSIAASEYSQRTAVTHFVPVNDSGGGWKGKTPSAKRDQDPFRYELQKLKAGHLPALPLKSYLAAMPEHRSRQPRSFPVAIPHDAMVRMIWDDKDIATHGDALGRLAAKVTNVGHSASFVQMWVEPGAVAESTWVPTDATAGLQMRVLWPGRLDSLAEAANRRLWIAYQNLEGKIDRAKAHLEAMIQPPRVPWNGFPDVVLLSEERDIKRHPSYSDAKSGGGAAATRLVDTLLDDDGLDAVRALIKAASATGSRTSPALVGVHACERAGVNAIPIALAQALSEALGLPYDDALVQTNVVAHTGADGFSRLARQAAFKGPVRRGTNYVMVDDFVGQGGTFANLRGWITKRGGNVIGAVALAGRWYSAKLTPSKDQLDELERKHGRRLERWWKEHFGHTFDCLTQSEARYLARSQDVDTIRDRIAAVKQAGNFPRSARSPRKQKRYIRNLTACKRERFPTAPDPPRRPLPGRWQGYARPPKERPPVVQTSVFDPHMIVLAVEGQRFPLPATLKATAALRGLLMRECPEPPPEWLSGQSPSGGPSTIPHVAVVPLPFVGSRYADGSVLGFGVILPKEIDPHEVRTCLHPFLQHRDTGLPSRHRLFDGQWLECRIQLATAEHAPKNLHPDTWTGGRTGSRVWETITPVVLDRHFKGEDKWSRAAQSVKSAFTNAGLPRPKEVWLRPVSSVEGVPHALAFPRNARKTDGGLQSHSHARFIFDQPVRGPVLVGAGRFRGYGLCRPVDEER